MWKSLKNTKQMNIDHFPEFDLSNFEGTIPLKNQSLKQAVKYRIAEKNLKWGYLDDVRNIFYAIYGKIDILHSSTDFFILWGGEPLKVWISLGLFFLTFLKLCHFKGPLP